MDIFIQGQYFAVYCVKKRRDKVLLHRKLVKKSLLLQSLSDRR